MRYRKRIVVAVAAAVLAILLCASLAWLAGTTGGLRFLAARVLPLLPVEVQADRVEGRLLGPLSLSGVELQGAGFSASIARIELDWRPTALFGRTVEVLHLRLESPAVALETSAAAKPAAGPAGFDPLSISLPMPVIVAELVLRDGRLTRDGEILLDELEVELAGRASGQQLILERLAVDSTRGGANGRLRASLADDQPWDVDLDWRVALEAQRFAPEIAGRSRISGPFDRLDFTQELSMPVSARAEGVVRGLPRAPSWRVSLQVPPLAEEEGWPELIHRAAARLEIEGELARSTLAGHVEVPALVAGEIEIGGALGWDQGALQLDELGLALPEGGQLVANGQFEPGGAPAADLSLRGRGIGWPLGAAEPAVAFEEFSLQASGGGRSWRIAAEGDARRGTLPQTAIEAVLEWDGSRLRAERLALDSADGTLQAVLQGALETGDGRIDYRLAGDARLQPPDLFPVDMRFSAEGDTEGLRLETLEAQLLDGSVQGGGWLRWAGSPDSEFNFQFENLDPAEAAPGWPGRLAGSLSLQGFPAAGDGVAVALESLRGELKSLPVTGHAHLATSGEAFIPEVMTLSAATLRIGDASLDASGRLGEDTVTFEASLDAPDLERLDAGARGRLSATARLEGSRSEPQLELQAEGRGLRWQGRRLRTLELNAALDLSGTRQSTLLAEARGFAMAPGRAVNIRLEGDGTPGDHRLELELERRRPAGRLELAAEGRLADAGWQGMVTRLALADAQQEIWRLQAPASVQAGTASAELDSACMDGTLGRLCLAGEWQQQGDWRADTDLEALELARLAPWLGAGLDASGEVTGAVLVEGDAQGFRKLDGRLEATAGALRLVEQDSAALLAWQGGLLELDGDRGEARAELSFSLAEGDRAEGRLVAGWNEADPPLDGRFAAELGQLQIISEFLPELARLEGRLSARASLAGTLSAPVVDGRLEWLDGAATIPELGLQPDDINLVAEIAQSELNFRATGRSGDGTFESHGRFDLSAEGVSGRAVLAGEDLLMAALPDLRLEASPDLRLHYAGRAIGLGGTVEIPRGRISGFGGPTAVRTSPDEVIVGRRARPPENGVEVTSRIRVRVGPDVQVQAAGLRGRIEGNLLTVTEPRMLPWGRGELRVVDGTFGAFGQRLQIETGRLIYTGGPLENPGLDIRAVRKVDQVTAGAMVRGTLKNPEISIYSDPPMPRAEALSYLTLGKSLDELQSGEQTTVNQAANSLALSGGGLIARDLGQRLGLDDVSVTAEGGAEGAALVVSKYLGGGLYVSYGLGLFDTINTLRLRYQVNKRLSLEATSGEEVEADLFYTFERD